VAGAAGEVSFCKQIQRKGAKMQRKNPQICGQTFLFI
jgi:hypothetical protein